MPAVTTWKCDVCGYIHEGSEPPAVCPVCGVGPELFSPFEAIKTSAPPVATAEGVRIVIVGGGVAAVTAADRARQQSEGAQITLIHKEPDAPYYRINLTRLLAGEVKAEELQLKPEGWYAERRIERVHAEVRSVDRRRSSVQLADGGEHAYDKLILACGGHPFVPPFAGVTREHVEVLRSLADARAVIGQATADTPCVCIGGGLLGLECAGALAKRGVDVTVVEGFERLLPRQLAAPAARRLQAHLEALGIRIRCGVKVEAIEGDEAVCGLRLDGGELVDAGLIVIATGVRPSSYLARQAGIEVAKGVLVDDSMRSSAANIFAAGDVAEHRGVVTGLWPTAYAQGAVAGTVAAGGVATYEGLPSSTQIKVLDVGLFSVGEFEPRDASYRVYERESEQAYLRVVCRDGAVVGANLYGDISLASLLQSAVEQGAQVREQVELSAALPELVAVANPQAGR